MKKLDEKMLLSCKGRGFYLNAKQLAEMQGCSVRHVWTVIKELRGQVEADTGRYNRYAFLDGGPILVNIFAYYDYCKYRKALKDPIAKKYVPEFNPMEIAVMCPVMERVVLVDAEDAADWKAAM